MKEKHFARIVGIKEKIETGAVGDQVWSNMKVFLTVFFFDCIGVRSMRNTILYADCAKQFVRNAQNCGKTNHGFYTMMTHKLKHRVSVLAY